MGAAESTEAGAQQQEEGSYPSALVIIGPSGVGKGTLITKLMQSSDRFGFSCSHTTREPRADEKVYYQQIDAANRLCPSSIIFKAHPPSHLHKHAHARTHPAAISQTYPLVQVANSPLCIHRMGSITGSQTRLRWRQK